VFVIEQVDEVVLGIRGRVELDEIFNWSDSEVALSWIRGKERSWEPWVENRVVTIRKVVDRDRWNFVKGELNPADIPTRISTSLVECFSGCWFTGPSVLLSQPSAYRGERSDTLCDQTSLGGKVVEEVSHSSDVLSNNVTRNDIPGETCSLSDVIDCTRYSSLNKLTVTTGYVIRFLNNLRKRTKNHGNLITENVLTADKYEQALHMWIKEEQSLIKGQSNFANVCAMKNTDTILMASLGQYKQQLKHLRKILRDCWTRFRREYLNELRQMNLYRKRKTNTRDLTIVDVVLIKEDELAPRAQWRIGRVLQLVKGRDGLVRGAKLKVLAKGGAQSSVHRSLQRLIPFEIVQDDVDKHEEGDDNDKNAEQHNTTETESRADERKGSRRPTRKAVIDGENLRRIREQYT
jgi:hypothetical protein